MRQQQWYIPLVAVCGVIALLAGCAQQSRRSEVTAVPYEDSPLFPVPAGLKPNVDFWRNVYAYWDRRQVAVHDDRYLDVIYEVVTLPGAVDGGYTPQQKALVTAAKTHWQAQLQALEQRVRQQAPLTREQRALRERLTATAGGLTAIYGAADRVRTQRGLRSQFRRGVEISGRYEADIRATFRARGLPEELAYLPHVESSFQTNARSTVGAAGIWQFMPSTGRQYLTVTGAIDQRLDPVLAADAAAQYLGNAYAKLGYWPLAITSYNHGVGGMKRAQATFGNDIARIVQQYRGSAFGFASRNFYAEFSAARHVARHADIYFAGELHRERPAAVRRMRLPAAMTVSEMAQRYQIAPRALLDANLAWLESIRSERVPIPAGTTVWLPTTN